MAIRLDDISRAIGALEQGQASFRDGQAAAEHSRHEHAQRTERQFSDVAQTLQQMKTSVDQIK